MEPLLALTPAELDALARVAVFTHGFDEWSWSGPQPATALTLLLLAHSDAEEFARSRPPVREDLDCTALSRELSISQLCQLAQLAVSAWSQGQECLLDAHLWLRAQGPDVQALLARADLLLSDDIGVAALLHQAG